MDWSREFTRFATHAAPALGVLVVALGPARPWLARVVARIGAARRGRVILLAVLLTLAVRAALIPVVHPAYEADAKEYCEKAAAIARDGHPRAEETRWDGSRFYRTLGYSMPLAGWYRVTGMPETPEARIGSAQAFNLLTSAAIAALIVALGIAVGRETAGRVAALAYALFLPAWMFSLLPYTETWATLLVVASALVFERMRRAEGRAFVGLGAAFGLLQGALLITRTELVWMPLLAAAWLLRERGARAIVPGVAAAALMLVPFAVNHAMRDGYPGTLRTSSQGGLILYFGQNPIEVNGYGNASPPVVEHVRALYAQDPTGGSARDEAVAWMKEHPAEVVLNAPKKLFHLWLAEPQGFTWHVAAGREGGTDQTFADVLRHVAWVEALVLLALGIASLVRWRQGVGLWTAAIALHSATWCILAASSRNRYPLEPLLLIAAVAWFETRPQPDGSGADLPS